MKKLIIVLYYVFFQADVMSQEIDSVLQNYCQRVKEYPGCRLPTCQEIKSVESIVDAIPSDLKMFYQTCGKRPLKGFDMAQVVGGTQSTLVRFYHDAIEDSVDVASFLPFCKDDENYYCINRQTGVIVYWEFGENVPRQTHSSFLNWLIFALSIQ